MLNTLVTHKKYGICCISKELKNHYRINVGTYDQKMVIKSSVKLIDTSKCTTISVQEYRSRIMKSISTLNIAILGNELKEFVGIGWITLRVVTMDDLTKYPRVV